VIVLPRLGLGTWEMGDDPRRRADEVAALRTGLDVGVTMIDTAEYYGHGRAEDVVGEALADGGSSLRDQAFVVSKVMPRHATRAGTPAACERSLRHLRTDRLDLYLVHWREDVPLDETVAALERLREQGKVRAWGVSNFDVHDMDETWAAPGGARCAADQVYYNLLHRGIERRLAPWCASHGVVVMAYTPVESGRLPVRPSLAAAAARHGVSPFAAAVAWTMRSPGFVTVVKTGRPGRVCEYAKALDVRLDAADLAALDRDYPLPERDGPLETI
jgi:diketogulonate reductase-like aldo/keto reductase